MAIYRTALAGTALCALLVFPARLSAVAAETDKVLGVKERPDPHFQPLGLRFRALNVDPMMEIEETHDDNIFRERASQKSDFITEFKPSLKVSTDWPLHNLSAGAQAGLGRYWKNSSENYDDYAIHVSGTYDITYGTSLKARVGYDRRHEDRSSLDDPDGDEPVEYGMTSGQVDFARDLSTLKLWAGGLWRSVGYDHSTRDGTVIDNGDRDRNEAVYRVKLGYALSDHSLVYASVQHDRRRYARTAESFRDSSGMDYRLGLSTDISGKLHADLYAGYLRTSYRGTFGNIGAVNFGGAFLWNIGEITSLRGSVDRSVVETTLDGSSGIVRTAAALGLEHAFRRNVIADASIKIRDDRYEGDDALAASRDNTIYSAGLGVEYLMNRNWALRAGYDYSYRDFGRAGGGDYANNKVMLTLRYAY